MSRLQNRINVIKDIFPHLLSRFKRNFQDYQVIKQIQRVNEVSKPFFVICIPGSLHLVQLFLRFFPKDENVILVLNGLSEPETNWAHGHFSAQRIVTIPELLNHGKVMDLLFGGMDRPFGILDYDLFITNHQLLKQLKNISQDSMGNVLYITKNQTLQLNFPQTFAMFFNTPAVKPIIQKFKLSCQNTRYPKLSSKIQQALSRIGIDATHLPEENKEYFDSTRVLSAVGLSEGYCFLQVDPEIGNSVPDQGVFHVNGVSDPKNISNRWRARGSYFWQTVLNNCSDEFLIDLYQKQYPTLPNFDHITQLLSNDGYTGDWFFNSVRFLLGRKD
jgi:hypothetical protein